VPRADAGHRPVGLTVGSEDRAERKRLLEMKNACDTPHVCWVLGATYRTSVSSHNRCAAYNGRMPESAPTRDGPEWCPRYRTGRRVSG
jgi:hypothetical protein